MKILVSIVVPAYNVEKYIELTLISIKKQSLKEFECIIVDDFSTDSTKEICMAFIKNDKRFKLIPHRANAGLSAARNTGLRSAKGKYICFLDSDDLLMTNSLEVRANTLETKSDDNIIGTYCGSLGITENCKKPPESKPVKLKKVDFISAGGNCPFNANQPMFVRETFKLLGGFDHSLKQAEDYDMWMRVLRRGYSIIPTEVFAVTYRATPGSMIKRDPLLHLATSHTRFTDCYKNAELYDAPINGERFLRKGLAEYLEQLNIANRVLEFVGIALGVGQDFALENRLNKYLPDYFEILESHRPFFNNVWKGVNRAHNGQLSSDKDLVKKYKVEVEQLYLKFKKLRCAVTELEKKVSTAELKRSHDSFEVDEQLIISQLGGQSLIDIVFIPHKDYHVATINSLRESLERVGLNFIIVDVSMHYRDEGVTRAAKQLNLPIIGYSNFIIGNFQPKVIVSFNDWDPIVRAILVSAQKAGIKTAAIVEGIQDYWDADTKQTRHAYRTADLVLLPGEFDSKYFEGSSQTIKVAGVPRIQEMRAWQKNVLNWAKPKALINSNFSYGVLEDARDLWVKDVVEACINAGYEPIISRHPADEGTEYLEYQTQESFYEVLKNCEVHISKFASGILEALAVGCPVVYYNSHQEDVDKFKEPLEAYTVVESKSALIKELKALPINANAYLSNVDSFLDLHAGNQSVNSSEEITKDLAIQIENSQISSSQFSKFSQMLAEIDLKTGCFNNLKYLRENFNPTYVGENKLINTVVQQEYSSINVKCFQELLKNEEYDVAQRMVMENLSGDSHNPVHTRLAFELIAILKRKNIDINPNFQRSFQSTLFTEK
jgi:glycosyltransferase involved in cell wall biosynthesis